jgi:two-component system alkaline phosphatase synthesis response regulator PhoP/two-component system response regulator MtrA
LLPEQAMAQVMVVEDDAAIANLVALYLRKDGHEVETVDNGAVALSRFESAVAKPDLIVLDLMLPGLDGRGVARRIRGIAQTPIIMLTALDDDRDKIEGLDLGADDYVTKPFNPQELVARVRAVLRRTGQAVASPVLASELRIGNVFVDPEHWRVDVNGQDLPLRTKEFELLAAFAANVDVVLTRDRLLERVWGGEFNGDTRTVDVHVSRLRERLESAGATVAIETIRSVGYCLRRIESSNR